MLTDGERFQEEIAKRDLNLAKIEKLEALDRAACDAMAAWLLGDVNDPVKIEALKNALDARATALANNGSKLLELARKQLEV